MLGFWISRLNRRRLKPPTPSATDIGLDRIFGRGTDFPHIGGSGAQRGTHRYWDNPPLDLKSGPARCRWPFKGSILAITRPLHANPLTFRSLNEICTSVEENKSTKPTTSRGALGRLGTLWRRNRSATRQIQNGAATAGRLRSRTFRIVPPSALRITGRR